MLRLARIGTWLLDVAVPPRCAGCGLRDCWLCEACIRRMPALPAEHCRVCAVPIASGVTLCPDCYRAPPAFARLDAPFVHDALAREVVHDLKYRGRRHLAPALARSMASALSETPDLVAPVPLHPSREMERGFNQSALLAFHIAALVRAPLQTDALRRTKPTPSQTGMSRKERIANVRGAFQATGPLATAHVLLVDDVCTTGATLAACARVLRRAGVGRVTAVVATRASTLP